MGSRSGGSRRLHKRNGQGEKTIREWEKLYPGMWILLQVTEQVNNEPARARVIATADDPEEFQQEWKRHRGKGVLTMLTYGPPLEPGPVVVASAA
ncbi:MAG TPA: hypothetical protein VEG60_08860 [Candidatus Binatia bacterium]|nr:hypothetical protein [Candidatus Binatia bacterium]